MIKQHTVLLSLSMVLSLAGATQAKIWVVAEDGSGDFTKIQPAVDAASDGDVIVVRDGLYFGAKIGKPITLVGAGPGRTKIIEGSDHYTALTVANVPAGLVALGSFDAAA